MKLEVLKTFKLANPKVWIAPWSFTEGQILETDDEYLIDRLLKLKSAKILDKKLQSDVDEKEEKEEKQHLTPDNKMYTPPKRKYTKRKKKE